MKASDWRIRIRRTMNESDQDAHSKAIDYLLKAGDKARRMYANEEAICSKA